jgi:pantoate--beta-alanine ligase
VRTIRTVAELRAALEPARRAGSTIGLVPTMGAFHDGHLSLLRRARRQCDLVVVSLFVNPAQFDEATDLASYPRDEARDTALAADHGADYLFAPSAEDIYPDGFATTVSIAGVTEHLEGAHRGRAHFDGVATVVAKLFNVVVPHRAYFGQKDAQQVAVIKQLVRDLDLPIEIVVAPTVREPDGLAMSSRNSRLSQAERGRATALYRALRAAEQTIVAGERDAAVVTSAARTELEHDIELEYLELVHPDTFAPIRGPIDGDVIAVVAARVGATRLIDNQPIQVPSTGAAAAAGSTGTEEALTCSARC